MKTFALTAMLAWLSVVASGHAQIPPRLLHISPAGAKAGATVDVSLGGTDLGKATALHFSHPGFHAMLRDTNRFTLRVDPDVPPGVYEVRVVNDRGVSNPRAFTVGTLDEVAKAKSTREQPQRVPLESTVNGRVEPQGVDYFRFKAQAGQRLLVHCAAREIDSRLEPVLLLSDAAGREVARSRSGGLLDFTAQHDGEFTLRLHDFLYRGGADFGYRLSIGTFMHADYAVPTASGARTTFALFGRNFPSATAVTTDGGRVFQQIQVDLTTNEPALRPAVAFMPAQAALDVFEYRHHGSQPALIHFPVAPLQLEQEPNSSVSLAQPISLHCEIAGQFEANGDRDVFSFTARKGEVWWVEVVSHRLGCATDPLVVVQRVTTNGVKDVLELNDSEPNVGGAEFNTSHRDPVGRFEVKEDGQYVVQVRDLFTHPKASGPRVYQLAIRKPAPDFRVVTLPLGVAALKKDAKEIVVNSGALRRGESLPVKVVALRRDGFNAELDVQPATLPPSLQVTPCRLAAGHSSALLFLTAADTTDDKLATLSFHGTAEINGVPTRRAARPATIVWGTTDPANEAAVVRTTSDTVVSISDDAVPIRVYPEQPTIECVANKPVKVNFLLERRSLGAAAVKLKPFGFSALDSVPEADLDAKATNLVLQIDLKEKKVPAGTHAFVLQVAPQPKPPADKNTKPKPPPPAYYSEPVVLRVAAAPAQTNSPAK